MQPARQLFTIGSSGTTAAHFFERLASHRVARLIDVRLNNRSQLLGFSKAGDLEFFAHRLAGITYVHVPALAPTPALLQAYREGTLSWEAYAAEFLRLLALRETASYETAFEDRACLLCSEPSAVRCHRRLVADYLHDLGRVDIVTHL